jgi:hypothetical protein
MTNKKVEIQKSPFILSDIIDDLVIVIHINTGAYYSLTADAGELWKKIESGVNEFNEIELRQIQAFVTEELLMLEEPLERFEEVGFEEVGFKFNDMEEMLMGDPIHEVDWQGWPLMKKNP